jgi:hypothetical protein
MPDILADSNILMFILIVILSGSVCTVADSLELLRLFFLPKESWMCQCVIYYKGN